MYYICKFWDVNEWWRFGGFCLFIWMDFCFGVGFYKMTVKWTLQTIPVACVNLKTVLEILNLIGLRWGSPVFPEFCPDSKSCLFGEIQVLTPQLGILFCYGDVSLCSSGNSFAEGMSQSRVPVNGLCWCWPHRVTQNPAPEVEASQDILLYASFPLALIPVMEGSCGLVGSTSPRSMYIFQSMAVWSGSWPLILYDISMICGAKIRNIKVFFCWVRVCVGCCSCAADAGRFNFWVVVSLASGQEGPRSLTYRNICFLVVRNCLKRQWLFF